MPIQLRRNEVFVCNPESGQGRTNRKRAAELVKRGRARWTNEITIEIILDDGKKLASGPIYEHPVSGNWGPTIHVSPINWVECWRTAQAAVLPPSIGYLEALRS